MTEVQAGTCGCAVIVLLTVLAAPGHADDAVVEVPGATVGRLGDSAAVDAESYEFSAAETKLWLDDHLRNIPGPMRLKYDFVRSGTYEEGFADIVLLEIKQVNEDGTKNADMQFFSGERAQPFTPDNVTGVRGNPVLGLYMRGDVYDMNRMTEGSWRYFQRRIKLALAEGAAVEPVEIEFNGRKLKGERVVITPYAKDPHGASFQQFLGKRYEFTFSESIPGMLYEIHTVVPGAGEGTQPLLEERLRLTQVDGAGAAR